MLLGQEEVSLPERVQVQDTGEMHGMRVQMSEEEFGLGPRWAWGGTCCGKPVGCTNMSDQCRMLNHPWKRWHREEFGAARPTEEPADSSPVE